MSVMCSTKQSAGLAFAAAAAMFSVHAVAQQQIDLRTQLQEQTSVHSPESDPLQPIRIDDLNRVDDSIHDISPLRRSLRELPRGLSVPSGFHDVYAVPGHPGWFMRANGGLYAVFRESIYYNSNPEIPHGAVFHIGPPVFIEDVFVFPDPAREFHSLRSGLVVPQSAPEPAHEDGPRRSIVQRPLASVPMTPRTRNVRMEAAAPASIIQNRGYRMWRLRELMKRAAESG